MIDYRDRTNRELAGRRTPLQEMASWLNSTRPQMAAPDGSQQLAGAFAGMYPQAQAQAAPAYRTVSRANTDPMAYGASGYEDRPRTAVRPAQPTQPAQAALTPQERAEMAVRYRQANQRSADMTRAGDRGGALEARAERDALGRAAVASSTYDNLNRSRTLPMSERTIKLDGSYDNAEMYGGATAPNQEAIAQRMLESGMAYRGQLAEADRIAKLRNERTAFGDSLLAEGRAAELAGVTAQGKMAAAGGRSADLVADDQELALRRAKLERGVAESETGTKAARVEGESMPTPDEMRASRTQATADAATAKAMSKSGLGSPEEQAAFVQSFVDALNSAGTAWDDNNDNNTKARTRMAGQIAMLEDLATQDPDIARQLAMQIAGQIGSPDTNAPPGGLRGALEYGPYMVLPPELRKYAPTPGNLVRAFRGGENSRKLSTDVFARLSKIAGIQ